MGNLIDYTIGNLQKKINFAVMYYNMLIIIN